jgi:hypothetical protein
MNYEEAPKVLCIIAEILVLNNNQRSKRLFIFW